MVLSVIQIDQTPGANGVVSTSRFEEALWSGRAFSAGTGVQVISDIEKMSVIFSNPTTDTNAVVVLRALYCNRRGADGPLEAGFVSNPVELEDMNDVTAANLRTGGSASVMRFKWATRPFIIDADPPRNQAPTGIFIPTEGNAVKIETTRIVGPGQSTGIFVRGADGRKDKATVSFVWYEEAV